MLLQTPLATLLQTPLATLLQTPLATLSQPSYKRLSQPSRNPLATLSQIPHGLLDRYIILSTWCCDLIVGMLMERVLPPSHPVRAGVSVNGVPVDTNGSAGLQNGDMVQLSRAAVVRETPL